MTKCAVILAAGRGTRFGNKKHSKLLSKIHGVSIIERLVQELLWAGIERIIMVVGFDYQSVVDEVKSYPVSFIYNPLYKEHGQMYSFSLAQNFINSDALLLDGDLIIAREDIKKLVNSVYPSILVDDNVPRKRDMGAIVDDKNDLKGLAYGEGKNVWMSISKLSSKLLASIRRIDCENDASQSDVLNFLSQYTLIKVIKGEHFWKNINTRRDLKAVKEALK